MDGVSCPDTGGVGTDGRGGSFNCGLTGSTFKLECTADCTSELAIVELKLWTRRNMALLGTPYLVNSEGVVSVDRPFSTTENLSLVFGVGSIWAQPSNWKAMYRIGNFDEDSVPCLAIDFDEE